MAFSVQNATIDVINKTANVVATDPQTHGVAKFVQVSFPFDPPPSEVQEKDRVIAEAKKVLQQALSEI